MNIYIIRHAHAAQGKDDAVRSLSKRGRKQVRRMGKFLRKHHLLVAREFWHSPLLRSRDTAKRLVKQLKARATLTEIKGLLHDDPPSLVAKRLERMRRSVAVVGHEPHLGRLISLLVVGPDTPVRFEPQKGAVIALARTGGRWLVQWHLAPEMLDPK